MIFYREGRLISPALFTWELHTGAAQLQEQDFVRTLAEEACGTDQPGEGEHCLTPRKVFGYVNLPDQDTPGMTFHVLDRVVVGLPYFPSFLLYL